jgi:hypothetical protein
MGARGLVGGGMGGIRTVGRPRLTSAIAALGIPLCALETASEPPASWKLAAPERSASVAPTIRPWGVLGSRSSRCIRGRMRLAWVIVSLGGGGRSIIVVRIGRRELTTVLSANRGSKQKDKM